MYTAFYEMKKSAYRITESTDNGNLIADSTIQQPASVVTDGVYIVQSISYTGDAEGNPWHMDLMCTTRRARKLQTNTTINRTS